MMDFLGDSLPDATPIHDAFFKTAVPRYIGDAERRNLLINAAEKVFLAKGYVATTMADIASAASMSKKTIYQIFTSKAELFDALMVERLAALPSAATASTKPPAEALRGMLMDFGRALLSPRQISLTRLILANIASVPQANANVTRRCLDIRRSLSDWLGTQVAAGAFQIADLGHTSEMLFSLTFATFQTDLLLALRETPSEEELAEQVDRSLAIFLREFAS